MRRDDKQLQVGSHTRTIQERPVTFTCQRCELERTEMRYPGPTPKYCHACRREVQLEQNRNRVQKHRSKS